MKTHLPHGLRVALMAAIASVSLTSYAVAADTGYVFPDTFAINWPTGAKKMPDMGTSGGTYNTSGDGTNVYYTGSGDSGVTWSIGLVAKTNKVGNYYADFRFNPTKDAIYLHGVFGESSAPASLTGSVYQRHSGNSKAGTIKGVYGVDTSSATGNVYTELNAANSTYQWATGSTSPVVMGAYNGDIGGSSTIVIKQGTFKGDVYAGHVGNDGKKHTIGTGTFLEIGGGSFSNRVVAGSATNPDAIIKNGTHLLVKGGTFSSEVVAGNNGSGIIEGGTHMLINNGTFNSIVYGGSTGTNSHIDNGVEVNITGGTFGTNSGVYALGKAGTVYGDVSLTIGNNAKFSNNNVISAGANGSVRHDGYRSSTVTLKDITGTSSLATNTTIKVMGEEQGSKLVMNNVDTTIKAQLSRFYTMQVTGGSDLTLTQATNANLGGVNSVYIDSGSTLTLNTTEQSWSLGSKYLYSSGTLAKTGTGKLAVSSSTYFTGTFNVLNGELELNGTSGAKILRVAEGSTLSVTDGKLNSQQLLGAGTLTANSSNKLSIGDASGFTGTINVQKGEVHLDGATAAKSLSVASGATLSVKEGNLFAVGGGNSVSINGATLAANEGNWTLNAATTVENITISGTRAVALGSDGDTPAVVSLSGNIDATKGNLILKNTAIAADTTATLSGNITFEGLVDNKGTLSLVDGSAINIDELTFAHNAHFVDGENQEQQLHGNGFLADSSVCLASGGSYNTGKVDVTLDGKKVTDMALSTKTEGGKTELHVSGFNKAEENTYFVNQGTVTHAHIKDVANEMGKTVNTIAVESKLVSDDNTDTSIQTLVGEGTLAKSGDGKLTVTDAKAFSGDMEVCGGTLQVEDADLMQMHKERKITVSKKAVVNLVKLGTTVATVKELHISGQGTLGVFQGDSAKAGESDANVGNLTLGSGNKIVIGDGGGTLEANLTTESGSILDFSAGATLSMGCDLTVNSGTIIVLSDADFAALQNGASVTLFTGVDNLINMDNSGLSIHKGSVEGEEMGGQISFRTDGNGNAAIASVPEPATATLSLLALAGLAARRKRK